MTPRRFDAHLDLAYLAECGRDMLAADPARAGEPTPPGAVTLPSLRAGHIRAVLGTIFLEADGTDACSFPAGDAHTANRLALRQLDHYHTWARAGHISFFNGITPTPPTFPTAPAPTPSLPLSVSSSLPLHLGILIEGADCILHPDDLAWWRDRGVVAVGLAWAKPSRYAGGNATDLGLTELGRALIREIDRLNLTHDVSHLSDRALAELLASTDRPVIASHSNSRALIATDNQRHLTDDTIKEIARRGGVIGLNLFSPFLIPGGPRDRRATLDQALAHVEHICNLTGHRRAVGLGSDADGGFPATGLPEGINLPTDFARLADALTARGWPDDDIHHFTWANWAHFWKLASPSEPLPALRERAG